MVLTNREKATVVVSNAVSVYFRLCQKPRDASKKNIPLIDFVLKSTPEELENEISMDLIDEIFDHVSKTQTELS